MGTDDCIGGDSSCWVESKPCKCGAQNWVATHVERVAIKFQGGGKDSKDSKLQKIETSKKEKR
ncbi:hypothetical protein Mgra_00009477 [Meloidogyne graminicola]|uniref:Uncharacterized protein n=1 Tax=Meloidogyne graminicola TaxID=189291 RepID=A0A8S9ZD41_9BILA|nr:hypothetical protein Mgra_00009477 [Meloidogyne graminicola]